MAEERYDRGHHAGATPEERIRNRLKTSAERSAAAARTKSLSAIHPIER